jgi:membrane-associated phospholipid phosphatase
MRKMTGMHPFPGVESWPIRSVGARREDDMTFHAGKTVIATPLLSLGRWWWAWVAVGALFWAAGLLMWAQQASGASLDQDVLFFFDPLRQADSWAPRVARWLTSYGMAALTAIYVLLMLLGSRFKQLDPPAGLYLLVIFSFGLSGVGGDLLKELLARPRPMVTYAEQLLVLSNAATPALPSGHATKSLALALPLLFLLPGRSLFQRGVKVLTLILALGVGFSRVLLGAHYLSDVLAGIGTALVGLPPAMFFANLLLRRIRPEQLPRRRLVWGLLLVVLTCLFVLM